MREYQYSITLARLDELPEVLKAYQAYKQEVNEIQTARVEEKVRELICQIIDEISTVEIPINPGRRELYLFECYGLDDDAVNHLRLQRLSPEVSTRDPDGSLLSADVRGGVDDEVAKDFDPQHVNTARIYRRLADDLRKVFKNRFPAGNVKLALKRERTRKVPAKQMIPEIGEIDVLEERITVRHMVITVAIPSQPLDPVTPKVKGKSVTPRKGKAKAKPRKLKEK